MKQAGVMARCARNGSAQAIAEILGICRVTLYNWKNQLLGNDAPTSMKLSNNSSPDHVELRRQLEMLQSELRQFQLERDLLKTTNEVLEKGLCVDPKTLSNREKTLLVEAHKEQYPLSSLVSWGYHEARTSTIRLV
jgi:putative transposase